LGLLEPADCLKVLTRTASRGAAECPAGEDCTDREICPNQIARKNRASGLPIEQPTKFELILNLKTAKEIGLTIP